MFFSPSGGWSAAEEPVSEKHRHCGATGSLAQCVVSELLRNSPVWRLPDFPLLVRTPWEEFGKKESYYLN